MERNNYSDLIAVAANQNVKERDFWLNKFSGELVKSSFPYDNNVKNMAGGKIERVKFKIIGELYSKCVSACKGTDHALHMLFTAVLVVLLHKYMYDDNNDIIVGSPIYSQDMDTDANIELINTVLALRNQINDDMTFKELLTQVRQTIIEAVENQNYPLEILMKKLGLEFFEKDIPLFDIAILVENIHDKKYLHHIIHLNMIFSFFRGDKSIDGVIEYNGALYREQTVERIIRHYIQVTKTVLFESGLKLSDIDLLSEEEKKQILYDFNDTAREYPASKAIHELFEEQVKRTPDHVALTGPKLQNTKYKIQTKYKSQITNYKQSSALRADFDTFGPMHLTYKELNEKSNQVAYLLREKGVLADSIIGIMMERSVEMIIGIIGILKAGGAYLPIDPEYPQERIDYMLKDSNAALLFTGRELSDTGKEKGGRRPGCVEVEMSVSLAYVIYTSGSTGRPKGVGVEHRSLVNAVTWQSRFYNITDRDHTTQYASFGFDASVLEIFPCLVQGALLHIIDEETRLEPEKLNRYFEKHGITFSFLPTPYCERFMELENRSLRVLLAAGDKLRTFIKRNYQLVNNYGPTENSVAAAAFPVDKHYHNIPIGKPIHNNCIFILNTCDLKLQPIGVVGELCIGGDSLSRGYLNNPELTAERFVDYRSNRSYRTYFSEKIYKTGDLARWLPDGNIEFIGRVDQQVKIRGFRIELGEIESQLEKHDKIREAVVTAKESKNGEKYLCAYVVADNECPVSQLGQYLSRQLPGYMIPSHFVKLDMIPLTPGGKVDRKVLPEPDAPTGTEAYTAPQDEIEKKLVEIWSEVLSLEKEKIGIDANFFWLGGHSLRAITMVSRVHKELNVKLPLAVLFKIPAIRDLAQYIKESAEDKGTWIEPIEKKEYYSLSSAQERFYVLQHIDPESTAYNMPITIKLEGPLVKERFEKAFKKLIDRHESLRTSFGLVKGEPIQRIHEKVDFAVGYSESSGSGPGKIIANFIKSFDLAKPPLLRLGFIKIAEKEHILMFDMHHIITDGISMGIFIKDLMAFYAGKELPPLRLQYKDFSRWQHDQLTSGKLKKQQEYWLGLFSGELPVLKMPWDYPRPPVQSFEGDSISFHFEAELSRKLNLLVRESGTTLYMVLLALYNILLSKYIRQKDVIVGTPTAGRKHPDLENIIGLLLETIAIRNYPEGEKTFEEFLEEVKENTLNAYENQAYPFSQIIKQPGIENENDRSRNPLFDVMLIVQNIDTRLEDLRIDELKIEPYQGTSHKVSKVDITLEAVEGEEGIFFNLEYCTKLFKRETMIRFINSFKKVASVVLEDRKIRLKDIEIPHDLIMGTANVYETAESEFDF
jgi:amino acid adenylation domain-containing protein